MNILWKIIIYTISNIVSVTGINISILNGYNRLFNSNELNKFPRHSQYIPPNPESRIPHCERHVPDWIQIVNILLKL